MGAPELDLPSTVTVHWSQYRKTSEINGERRGAISTGKLFVNLDQATGGKHYVETMWGRGYVLRDPAPEPAALPRAADV